MNSFSNVMRPLGLLFLLASLLLVGCQSDSSSEGSDTDTLATEDAEATDAQQTDTEETDTEETDTEETEQALFSAGLGALKGATVTLEVFVENDGWQIQGTFETLSSDDFNEQGQFDLTDVSFNSDSWYRFTASDGELLDIDLDGIEDETSTEFKGKIRAIAKGEWLNEVEGSNINLLTEVAYMHILSYLEAADVDWDALTTALDEFASLILLEADNSSEDYASIMALSPYDLSRLNSIHLRKAKKLIQLSASGLSTRIAWAPFGDIQSVEESSCTAYDAKLNTHGTIVYAACYRGGFLIKSLLTGESTVIGTGDNAHSSIAIDELNGLGYINNGSGNGVHVINLDTNTYVEKILTSVRANEIEVSALGDYLYFSNSSSFNIYKLSDESLTTVNTADYGHRMRLSDDGTLIYIGGNNFASAFNLVTETFDFYIELDSTGYDIWVNNDASTAYVANNGDGLTIINLADESYVSYDAPDSEDVYGVMPFNNDSQLLVVTEYGVFTYDIASDEYVDGPYNTTSIEYGEHTAFLESEKLFIVGVELNVLGTYNGVDVTEQVTDYRSQVYNVTLNSVRDEVAFSLYDGELGIYNQNTDASSYTTLSGRPNKITTSLDGQTYYVAIIDAGIGVNVVDAETLSVSTMAANTVNSVYTETRVHQASNYLYALDDYSYDIDVFDIADNAYVKTIDVGSCKSENIVFDAAQDFLYAACTNDGSGLRRMNVNDEAWESFDIHIGYSLALNEADNTLYLGGAYELSYFDLITEAITETIVTTQVIFDLDYTDDLSALFIGGNSGPMMIDVTNNEIYELDDRFGNVLRWDAKQEALFYGAGSDGLYKIDLSNP